jgi:uncharacterized protein YyaL (SSP411 family)
MVDRDELPEVDAITCKALVAGEHGGWPVSAFCMPDGGRLFGHVLWQARARWTASFSRHQAMAEAMSMTGRACWKRRALTGLAEAERMRAQARRRATRRRYRRNRCRGVRANIAPIDREQGAHRHAEF